MNNKFMKINGFGVLILTILTGLLIQTQTNVVLAKVNDDAQAFTEVKTVIECLEKSNARGLNPPSADDLKDSVCTKLNETVTNFVDLLAKSDLLIEHQPKTAEYYLLRGKVRYYKNLTGLSMFSQTLVISSPEYLAKVSSADIAAEIKDFSDALTVNPTAKLDNYKSAEAHRFRGKIYTISAAKSYSRQILLNALADFAEAGKLDEWVLPADDFRKQIYLLSQDGDLVGQDFARRIKENPSDAPSIYLERAKYLSLIVDYNRALADLMRYADLPGSSKPVVSITYSLLNRLAGDAYKKSNISTAEDYLEKASLEIQFPQNVEAAFNDATQAEKLNQRLTAAYVIRAKYLVGSGKVDEGMTEAYFALVKDPDNVGALCIRGLGLAMKNDFSGSLDDLNRAIALDPELSFLYNAFGNRSKIYAALGKTDLANADIQKAQSLAQTLAEIRK